MEHARAPAPIARPRRRSRRLGGVGLVVAVGLPWLLFHHVIATTAFDLRLNFRYLLSGWVPWLLIAAGIACFVPVAISEGRDPEGRFYPRSRAAYMGWGISLYLLGFALATQVAQIYSLSRRGA